MAAAQTGSDEDGELTIGQLADRTGTTVRDVRAHAADTGPVHPRGDGDAWTTCALGHRHWGLHGAAGLLLVAPGPRVLLQHRAPWSHHGDTWGIPGGARASTETAREAALREAEEETGVSAADLVVDAEFVDDHGGWSYTTVRAHAPRDLPLQPERESLALEWVDADVVADRPLHPGFAAGWPAHLSALSG